MSGEAQSTRVGMDEVEFALLRREVSETKTAVDEIKHILKDNGTPGLVSTVRDIKANCERVQAAKKEHEAKNNTNWTRFGQPIYNIVITTILVLVVSGIVAFFQLKNESSRMAKLDTIMNELAKIERPTAGGVPLTPTLDTPPPRTH